MGVVTGLDAAGRLISQPAHRQRTIGSDRMISLVVHNMQGSEVGTYEFDPADLAPGINKQLLHDVIVMYESKSSCRHGAQKNRHEVSGSTKKLFRQKGTGNARVGPSGLRFVSAADVAFRVAQGLGLSVAEEGCQARDPHGSVEQVSRRRGDRSRQSAVDRNQDQCRRRHAESFGRGKASVLLTIAALDDTIWRSGRNIELLQIAPARELNAYDLLHQKRFVITREALDQLRASRTENDEEAN